jgi:hypothetical protein
MNQLYDCTTAGGWYSGSVHSVGGKEGGVGDRNVGSIKADNPGRKRRDATHVRYWSQISQTANKDFTWFATDLDSKHTIVWDFATNSITDAEQKEMKWGAWHYLEGITDGAKGPHNSIFIGISDIISK